MSFCGASISSENLSGVTTEVTFRPCSGGTISLGTQVFPFNYVNEYYFGTYDCYVPLYDYVYTVEVPCPSETPTPTPTVTPTETLSETVAETPTPTPTQTPWDYCYSFNGGFNNQAETAFEDENGKILFGGYFTTYSGIPFNRIVRINSDASVDDTFNIGSGFNNAVFEIKVQSDEKIVVGGDFTSYSGFSSNRIIRLNADGSIDNTFSAGTGFNGVVWTVEPQLDGKILVGGSFTQYNGNYHPGLIRLNSDGSVDNTLNVGSGTNNSIFHILVQDDGKLILLGGFTMYNGETHNRIVRLNNDGSLDTTFSAGTGFNGITYDGIIESDGKLVIVGEFFEYNGTVRDELIRLNSDGSIDETLIIGNGFRRTSGTTFCTTIKKYFDKYFIVGDFDTYSGSSANGLIRLNENGSIDESFDTGTGLLFSATSFNIGIILSSGIHVVYGTFTEYNGYEVNNIAFLNPFGTLMNCPLPTPTPTTTPTVTPT
jgi:uncharacterized delta-60 repeat protein